jgi:azurin
MKKLFFIPVVAATMLFAACGGESTNTSNEGGNTEPTESVATTVEHPTEITVKALGNTMPELEFDLKIIKVNAGKEITLTLVNEGIDEAMMHNFVIVRDGTAEEVAGRGVANKANGYVQPEDPAVIAASPMTMPGETVAFTFTLAEKGAYQFVCTYPGHWSRMLGKIIAE